MHLKSFLLWPFVAGSILLFGCSSFSGQSKAREALLGCWYGEDLQANLERRVGWLIERKQDGTFTVEFRSLGEQHLPIQTEEGYWSLTGNTYTTITATVAGDKVDTSNPQYTDVYEIKSKKGGEMSYYHPGTKQAFTAKKVACDYKAP